MFNKNGHVFLKELEDMKGNIQDALVFLTIL
jgi:hypothetical protein